MENSIARFFMKDINGRYLIVNTAFARSLGKSVDEIIDNTDFDLYPYEKAENHRKKDEMVIKAKEPLNFEEEDKHGSKLSAAYLTTKYPLINDNGEVYAIGGVSTDITERKRIEERMKLLSMFTELNPNMILRISENGKVTYANPTAQNWLKENDFTSYNDFSRIMPENIVSLCNVIRGSDKIFESEIKFNDQYYRFKIKPFHCGGKCDECGQCAGGLVTFTDITELKSISLEKEMYFEAFRNSSNAIAITDTAGNILHLNKAFETLYGYTQEEAEGKNPRILNPGRDKYRDNGYGEEDYNNLFKGMWKAIKDPKVGHWDGEVINRKKDGGLVWCDLSISAIKDENYNTIAYFGMPIDITERRKQELEIRLECYRTISELAEARDNETGEHLNRMAIFSTMIAEKFGMPEKYVNDMMIFAPLHDIGKVGISDSILLAPRKLTYEEFEIMKTHGTIGYNILKGRKTLEMAAEIAGTHHEKWDGSGYPKGLKGKSIPLCGRIVAIADVYDALRSHRPYKEPWNHEDAKKVIIEGSGKHFDPELVEIFLLINDKIEAAYADHLDS